MSNDFYIVARIPAGVAGATSDTIISCTAAGATACTAWEVGVKPLRSNASAIESQTVVTNLDLSAFAGATVYAGYAWGGAGFDKIGQERAWKYISQVVK